MKILKNVPLFRCIAILLVMALFVSSFSELAYAVDIPAAVVSEDEVTEENITGKTESTTTYYLGNEKSMTVWHGGNVRFKSKKGELKDYAPELKKIETENSSQKRELKDYLYTNMQGDAKHYFPEKIETNSPVIMEKEDYSIEMSLTDKTIKMLGLEETACVLKEEKVQTIEGEEELPVTAVYENRESASLSLTSSSDSVKETITLFEKPKSNIFTYEINLGELTAKKNVLDEGITYIDQEKDKMVGFMPAPWMNDASGKNYSENIKCDLKKTDEKGKYIVTMTVDEKYLSSNDTKYPVVIDPTSTWVGDSEMQDVYVISGSTYGDMNFYDSGTKKMPVGKNNTGYHRTFLKILNLKAQTLGKSIASAKLTVYETGSGESGQQIGVYRCDKSWTVTGITYNNRPGGATLYDTVTTKGTANTAHTFDLKAFAKNVANDSISNYGLMLYNKTESPGIGVFYGGRTTATSYRPKLVVTYYSVPTTPTSADLNIKEGKSGNKFGKTLYVKNSTDLTMSYSGITSDGLKRVEQRIRYWDDVNQKSGSIAKDFGEDAAITNGGTMPSLTEGCYVTSVRGVNKADVAGGHKVAGYFHVDKTLPVINTYSLDSVTSETDPTNNVRPTVSWNVSDKHFRSVSIIQNGEIVKTGLTPKVGSYKYAEGNTAITKSGKYDIKIRAYDWAGNYKDSSIIKYYLDTDPPKITTFASEEESTVSSPSAEKTPKLTWTVREDLISEQELFLNDEKIEDEEITSDVREYTLKDGMLSESGRHEFTLKVKDSCGNESVKKLEYYTDFEAPLLKELRIIPETGVLSPSANRSPRVFWEAEDTSKLSIFISVDGNNFIEAGSDILGSFMLPSDIWERSEGAYNVYVKAVDKAGNESDVKTLTYHLSDGKEYRPSSFEAEEYYGKNILSWQLGRYDKEEVIYDIHRENEPGFEINDENIIAEDIDAGKLHFIDSEILEDSTYFYKICIRDRKVGNIIAVSDEVEITVSGISDSFSSKNGNKEYLSYEEIALPTGTVSTEKSSGILNFAQSDFTVSNPQFEYGMERSYSSERAYSSMTGAGWLDSYHLELYKKDEDYILVEPEGCVYLFEKDKGYLCDETKEYLLLFDENSNPEITLKDGTVYAFNSFGQLELKEEPNGCMIKNIYDEKGRLDSVISKTENTEERNLKFTYEKDSRLLKEITDFEGTSYSYSFRDKNLVETKISKGSDFVEYEYQYDQSGKLSIIKDGEGNPYSFSYENEKVKEATYPDGEKVTFTYTESDGNIRTKVLRNTSDGKVISETETITDKDTGKVRSFKDASGNEHTFIYEGYLLKEETQLIEYEELVDDKVILKPLSITTTYEYDDNDNQISEVSTAGESSTYTFDDENNMISETLSEDGGLISDFTYEYDSYGNMTESCDNMLGEIESFTYNEDGNEKTTLLEKVENLTKDSSQANIELSKSSTSYDGNGNIEKLTVESGQVTLEEKMTYDSMGRVKSSVSDGVTSTYEYDFLGRVTTETVKEAGKEEIVTIKSYDKNGSLKTESSTAGPANTYTYDSRNRNTKTHTNGDGITSRSQSISYESQVNLEIHTGTGEKTIPFVYVKTVFDTRGQEVSKEYTDCEGKVVRSLSESVFTDQTYDRSGNCIAACSGYISDGLETVDSVSLSLYDSDGNLTAEIRNPEVLEGLFAAGSESIVNTYNYDKKGNLIEQTDGKGALTEFAYDDEGRMISCDIKTEEDTDPVDLSISYSQDDEGNETALLTDANGNMKKEVTDVSGLLLGTYDISATSEEDTLSTEYIYDSQGRVEKEEYKDGSYIKYSYENDSERIHEKSAYTKEGTLESIVNFSYDISGNVISEVKTGSNNEEIYKKKSSYDCEGKILSSQVWYRGENEGEIEYGYDTEGRLISKEYPADSNLGTVLFSYDNLGRVTSVSRGNQKIRDYIYDQARKLTETKEYIDNSSYYSTVYSYDSLNRASSITYKNGENIFESFEYSYDKNDNITQMYHLNNMLSGEIKFSETRKYVYDNLGNLTKSTSERLSGENTVTSVTEYAYDDVGNRISETIDGSKTEYTYNGLNQLVSSSSGNIETEYVYDQRGNQILKSSADGKEVECTFAVTGEMLTLTESSVGNDDIETVILTQENIYSSGGQRIQKTENEDEIQYFYDEGVVAYSKEGTNISSNVLGLEGDVIGNIQNDEYSVYFKDVQGSTSSIVGEDIELKASYRYSDFGETKELTGSTYSNEICYTGAIFNDSTGLYYMNARHYSPEDGRFISQDTHRANIYNVGQTNLYAYCNNNPINRVDKSGYSWETLLDVASIGWSYYEFTKAKSWKTVGYLVWDIGAAFIPFLPGSYVKKTIKGREVIKSFNVKIPTKVSELQKGEYLIVGSYKSLDKMFRWQKRGRIEIHHIIEKRFYRNFSIKENRFVSVALDKKLHREITNRWEKAASKYKINYNTYSISKLRKAINAVYYDMPELKELALKQVREYGHNAQYKCDK